MTQFFPVCCPAVFSQSAVPLKALQVPSPLPLLGCPSACTEKMIRHATIEDTLEMSLELITCRPERIFDEFWLDLSAEVDPQLREKPRWIQTLSVPNVKCPKHIIDNEWGKNEWGIGCIANLFGMVALSGNGKTKEKRRLCRALLCLSWIVPLC